MAKTLQSPAATVYLLLLAVAIGSASSARLLDELDLLPGPANPLPTPVPAATLPQPNQAGPTTTNTPLPSGQIPAVPPVDGDDSVGGPLRGAATLPQPNPAGPTTTPTPLPSGQIPVVPPAVDDSADEPAGGLQPGTATSAPGAGGGGATSAPSSSGATSASGGAHPTLSFFMHDIVGGSQPTARMVTGLVASAVSNVAFTKANNNIFPVSGGVPLTTANVNGFLNSNRNNLPFLAGLNGQQSAGTGFSNAQTTTVIQNSGNNNIVAGGTSLPFVAAGQLPAGAATLQKLMFGSVTVIDDELTEDHELGSAVLGRAQGFYLASSLDGNSHTMVLTLILHGAAGDHHVEDTISLFGVHRTATLVSHVAVIGGTGKFENAQGYATVESLPQVDQHTTDGVDTIMHVNIYLSD